MNNDPELNGKYLGTITRDFVKIAQTISEASYHVRKRKISDFPIFPICKIKQPVGALLLGRKELDLDWHYYASFLEEFLQRGLVDHDYLADFKAVYKNPEEFCCLFVIDEDFTNFVFIPYPEDGNENDNL